MKLYKKTISENNIGVPLAPQKYLLPCRCTLFLNNNRRNLLQMFDIPSAHLRSELLPIGPNLFLLFP